MGHRKHATTVKNRTRSSSQTRWFFAIIWTALAALCACNAFAQRYVIADEDAAGPGGSDMRALLLFLQSPDIHLLGITVVTGDQWRDEEVAHALRLVEIVGRTDVRVYPGAAFPLLRTPEWTRLADKMYGSFTYEGAFSEVRMTKPWDAIPPMPEGEPSTRAAKEDAVHFMIRMVHKYPHEVTIYAGGPLTDIALAVRLDPHFAGLAQQLVIMGGGIDPVTKAAEWVNNPRHEFNFWFDPEAASIVLRAPWAKITTTTIDVSLKTRLAPEVLDALAKAHSLAAVYITKYSHGPDAVNYLWDELAAAAWIDPTLITGERYVYMDVNTMHGPSYGDTLTWGAQTKPELPLNKVHAQMDVDLPRLQKFLIDRLSQPAPHASPSTAELTR